MSIEISLTAPLNEKNKKSNVDYNNTNHTILIFWKVVKSLKVLKFKSFEVYLIVKVFITPSLELAEAKENLEKEI